MLEVDFCGLNYNSDCMSQLDEATEAAVADFEEVLFHFTLDSEEKVVGVRGDTDTSFRLIIAKDGGADVFNIPGDEIVMFSLSNKVERRGLLKRLLGKEGEVQSVTVSTKESEVDVRLPRESARLVVDLLGDYLEPYQSDSDESE